MLKEFIEHIQKTTQPLITTVNGSTFRITDDGNVKEILPTIFHPDTLDLNSLDALVTMVRTEASEMDAPLYIAVPDCKTVRCFGQSRDYDERCFRQVYYEAHATDVPGWEAKTALGFEEAQIALRTRFQETPDTLYAMKLVSDISLGAKVIYNDMQYTQTELINAALSAPDTAPMTLEQIVSQEIEDFRKSPQYAEILTAEEYYKNRSDIQKKQVDIEGRSNCRIEHPIYRRVVDQKVRYLLSRPWSVSTENKQYGDALTALFDNEFRRKIQRIGKNAIRDGVGWLQPYIDSEGKLCFSVLPYKEVIPLWKRVDELDGFIRFYEQTVFIGQKRKRVGHAEFWNLEGVRRFTDENNDGHYKEIPEEQESHFTYGPQPYNWTSVPLIWLRYNEEELPLLRFIKELVDDYNWQTSVTADVLRDIAKFIYVLRNYGGEDLGQFLVELKKHLAIRVDGDGGVDKLQADINVDAVLSFLDKQRRDLYDFASAVDTKDPDLGNASGKAIGFRYMDLDADCADLGAELQAAFLRMKPFLDTWLQMKGVGDFRSETFDIQFNMDMPVDETEIIANINSSASLLSKRTLLENHPWVKDVDAELAAIKKQREQEMKDYGKDLFSDDDDGGDPGGDPNQK